jgi:hypothetical protein
MVRWLRLPNMASAHEATIARYVGSCGLNQPAFQWTLQGMI